MSIATYARNVFVVALGLAGAAPAVRAQEGAPLSLSEAVELALRQNPSMRRAQAGIDLAGALDFELFASVINFLDIENIVRVNETTGRPDRTGFEDQRSLNPRIANTFLTEVSDGEYPFNVDSEILEEWRDEFGRQDLNGDGTITLEEGQESLRLAHIASGAAGNFQGAVFGDSPYNYGEPRQLRFGAELRF